MIRLLPILNHRSLSLGIASLLTVMVGILDLKTGREWHVVPLYLLPLGLAAWGGGRIWGVVFSVLISGVWLLAAELAEGPAYTNLGMPFWNSLMFLCVFLAVALLLARLHLIMDTLDRRVRVRTARLQREMSLRHQAELAKLRAERLAVVGSMAAQMAHEVRNPISSISLNLELLAHEVGSLVEGPSAAATEAGVLMGQMEQELSRIERVINDYLGFSRLPKSMPGPNPLHAFLDEKLALIGSELHAAGVTLVRRYDPRVDLVKLDPARFWQVLLNLICNAREAMPEGGKLTLSTRRQDEEIIITLQDTGTGISDADLASVFTPFFTTKARGTGLGLPLSQQIVAEHGGRLECQSLPGKGTTFTISLPVNSSSTTNSPAFQTPPTDNQDYELPLANCVPG